VPELAHKKTADMDGLRYSLDDPYYRLRDWNPLSLLLYLKPVTGFRQQLRLWTNIFRPSRLEPLYQPYFGVWLFAWSKCGRIVTKVAEKMRSTNITFAILLLNHYGTTPSGSATHGAKTARNPRKHLNASYSMVVERTINQITEVLLLWQLQLNPDHLW